MRFSKSPLSPAQELDAARALAQRSPQILWLSSRIAAVLGALSIVGAGVSLKVDDFRAPNLFVFAMIWSSVFFLTIFISELLAKRVAGLPANGHEMALRSFFPFWLLAAFTTMLIVPNGVSSDLLTLTVTWIMAHGLSLISQRLYLPQVVVNVGWLLFVAGCVALTLPITALAFALDEPLCSSVLMGSTFGVLHLGFAAVTWKSGSQNRPEKGASAPTKE
jgi:hypothetical protein